MKPINTKILENKLHLIESYIPYSEQIKIKVSKVNIAWHLYHSLKVINAVVNAMSQSTPMLYKNDFSFLGKVLLAIGFFPRGKVKAPKHVTPPEVILNSDIISQLFEARENISKIENFDKNAYFKHPLFGHINTRNVVRFLNVHTNHHLKIAKSILK